MNMWRYWRIAAGLVLVLSTLTVLPAVSAQDGEAIRIIFMHHSTGRRLIEEGLLKEGLAEYGIELWDHGYNEEGLVSPEWDWLGTSWEVPNDNTDPDGWRDVFLQQVTAPPINTFSHMLEYDVIMFKSCYPNAHIDSDAMLEQYKAYYLEIRDVMDQHPDKLFIPFTNPPLVPNETTPEAAARAIEWAAYLMSDEYLEGHPNIVPFDFFSLLADEDGFLREEYRVDAWDSHPNRLANETVGPIFIEFAAGAVATFVPGDPYVAPTPVSVLQTGEDTPRTEPLSASFMPFEEVRTFSSSCADYIWDWAGGGELAWRISHTDPDYTDVVQIDFDLRPGDYGGMGIHFAPNEGWAGTEGIGFAWRADQMGTELAFSVGVQDPTDLEADESMATPFEFRLYTSTNEEWQELVLPWEYFVRATWWDRPGVDVLDPANVIWVSFGLGSDAVDQEGTIYIANIDVQAVE